MSSRSCTKLRSEVVAQNGMVCSSQPLCSQIGLDVLKAGGNAVDAAIAVNAAQGLMEPMSCGLGGDLVAMVYWKDHDKLYGIESIGKAPKKLTYEVLRNQLRNQNLSEVPGTGMLPITVPGCAAGWGSLLSKFGSTSLANILAPTIYYAQHGFPVSPVIAEQWAEMNTVLETNINVFEDFRRVFFPNGAALSVGDIFTNHNLADCLQSLAENGLESFYSKSIAKEIDSFMATENGYLSLLDLSNHEVEWVDPVSVCYRGCDVYEMGMPTQGISVLQMLNILENFDMTNLCDISRIHNMIEAKKLVYEDRAKLFSSDPSSKCLAKDLLSKDYGDERARKINANLALQKLDSGHFSTDSSSDTVYIACADKEGNMVSLMQSIYKKFGSKVVVPGTGFCLQNRGSGFSVDANHTNCFQPDKRPFHTIIPGFVFRESKPFLCFGVMGGAVQPQGQIQVISNIIDKQMDVQSAGDAPRWFHYGSTEPSDYLTVGLRDGGNIYLEPAYGSEVVDGLKQKGHVVLDSPTAEQRMTMGGYQGIMLKNNVYHGATESRLDGQACGY